MKIPITDQFLWLIYEFFEKTGEVLDFLGVGVMTLRDITPLDREFWRKIEKRKRKRQFAQFINYLKKQGYIEIADLKTKRGILLTPKGKRKALRVKYSLGEKENFLQKRKDNKMIMVIFDIPEKLRKYRDNFRIFLYSLGFQPLQKSVWISPYDVMDRLREIIRVLNLDKFIKIFLIEEKEI